MAQNFYTNYDPISANGILYAPIKDLTFSDAPVTFPPFCCPQLPMNQANAAQIDKFVSSAKNPDATPTWKKVLFYGLLAGATLWGLKKFKINPFKKLTSKPAFQNIKNAVVNGCSVVKDFVLKKYDAIKSFILRKRP